MKLFDDRAEIVTMTDPVSFLELVTTTFNYLKLPDGRCSRGTECRKRWATTGSAKPLQGNRFPSATGTPSFSDNPSAETLRAMPVQRGAPDTVTRYPLTPTFRRMLMIGHQPERMRTKFASPQSPGTNTFSSK